MHILHNQRHQQYLLNSNPLVVLDEAQLIVISFANHDFVGYALVIHWYRFFTYFFHDEYNFHVIQYTVTLGHIKEKHRSIYWKNKLFKYWMYVSMHVSIGRMYIEIIPFKGSRHGKYCIQKMHHIFWKLVCSSSSSSLHAHIRKGTRRHIFLCSFPSK